jgi:demethylmenaquinone methyltransferase/2-methoxy-6-polyprenyl-1,4-benzoquinol methylase
MTGTDLYIQRLLESNPLREPLLRKIIQILGLPTGSHGLDAGCGIGLQTLQLLEAVGSKGHVTGLDLLPELLAFGKKMIEKADFSDQITFREEDVSQLPFDDDLFDWAWSADCVGYPAGEIIPALNELVRVVKPGGRIFLLGWSSQQLLPGHPLLEARLNGTCSSYAPFYADKSPETNFMRALRSLREVGLDNVHAQTFTSDVQAPLAEDLRRALAAMFEMLWQAPAPVTEDWRECLQLSQPGSPDFVLNLSEYYGFFTYTLFQGVVRK